MSVGSCSGMESFVRMRALVCAHALASYYYYPLPYSPFSFHRIACLKRKNRGSAWRDLQIGEYLILNEFILQTLPLWI